jgi:hypothetical protein
MLTVASYVGVRQGPRFVAFYGRMFYGLMRPAEVAYLTKAGCYLPEKGWGLLTFGDSSPAPARNGLTPGTCTRNAGSKGAPAKLSAGCRSRRSLSASCGSTSSTSGQPLMAACSERGGVTQPSTWWQVWRKVRNMALTPEQLATPLMERPYDLRHGFPRQMSPNGPGAASEVLTRRWPGRGVDRPDERRSSPRRIA